LSKGKKIGVRRGLPGGQYKPLADQEITKIDETTLRVFDEVGIQVRLAEARNLFRNAGAKVDEESCLVKIPSGLVEELIGKAPPVITLCGRAENGELDCEIGWSKVYTGTGGTALNVQDPGSDDCRRANLEDIKKMAALLTFSIMSTFTCSMCILMNFPWKMWTSTALERP